MPEGVSLPPSPTESFLTQGKKKVDHPDLDD
jgi:hypothetical protein